MTSIDTKVLSEPMHAEGDFNDYFVRLLGVVWRFRLLCIGVLFISAFVGILRQSHDYQFRTTLGLRLVSPCVAYRHSDYWIPASKTWKSQLSLNAVKYSVSDQQISVRAGDDPWLLTLVADHDQPDTAEALLRELARESSIQLHAVGQVGDSVMSSASQCDEMAVDPMSLMLNLRHALSRVEAIVSKCRKNQEAEVIASDKKHETDTYFQARGVSGTWSTVPIESVPYFPWFERLHEYLSKCLAVCNFGRSHA